jgi:hypothetical protein
LFLREAGIATIDIGEREKAGDRLRRFGVRREQPSPSCGAKFDRLLEAGDPEFPEDFVMSLVDGEQRTIVIGPLHQRSGDIVVMLHHETENSVEMVDVVEGRGVFLLASPDDRQLFAWLDELRADDQAGDEAVQLFEQHRCFAKGKEFFFKLLDMTRAFPHEASTSKATGRRSG